MGCRVSIKQIFPQGREPVLISAKQVRRPTLRFSIYSTNGIDHFHCFQILVESECSFLVFRDLASLTVSHESDEADILWRESVLSGCSEAVHLKLQNKCCFEFSARLTNSLLRICRNNMPAIIWCRYSPIFSCICQGRGFQGKFWCSPPLKIFG